MKTYFVKLFQEEKDLLEAAAVSQLEGDVTVENELGAGWDQLIKGGVRQQ